jgi:hypothetical protein
MFLSRSASSSHAFPRGRITGELLASLSNNNNVIGTFVKKLGEGQ